MSYSKFTLALIEEQLGLTIQEGCDLFSKIAPVSAGEFLTKTLERNLPLALPNGSEKARSEWVVAPILSELRVRTGGQVSVFSGIDLTVDRKRGLDGFCDFLVAHSPHQLELEAPVLCAVEAKEHSMKLGIPQCIATMYAVSIYNANEKTPRECIHGLVTTGSNWLFLRLCGTTVQIERTDYHIKEIDKILGILLEITGASL
jgi:hypothetical protein